MPALVYWFAGSPRDRPVSDRHRRRVHDPADAAAVPDRIAAERRRRRPDVAAPCSGAIFEYLDLPVDIIERAEPASWMPRPSGEVRFDDVSFQYEEDGARTLDGVDLVVAPGTTTAIVGETGSGKTTLGYLVSRLYDVTGGRVTIDGVDIRDLSFALARTVGLLSQNYLFHATIADNLRFAKPEATDAKLVAAARAARIHELIASLPEGYDTVVGERDRLSSSEKQRIAIARTILRNPPVLVLDEATSALDSETERAVQEALDQLAEGRTTIAIAHRLSTVRDADEIVVLDHGAIAERGTHDELLAAGGRYAQLVAVAGYVAALAGERQDHVGDRSRRAYGASSRYLTRSSFVAPPGSFTSPTARGPRPRRTSRSDRSRRASGSSRPARARPVSRSPARPGLTSRKPESACHIDTAGDPTPSVTKYSPSDVHAARVSPRMRRSAGRWSTLRICAPVSTRQTRAVPSGLPVSNREPSGENSTEPTLCVCPRMTRSRRPDATPQTRAVPSAPPVTTRRPSAEKSAVTTPRRCSRKPGSSGEDFVEVHRRAMPAQIVQPLAVRHRPQRSRLVRGGRHEPLAVV